MYLTVVHATIGQLKKLNFPSNLECWQIKQDYLANLHQIFTHLCI